MKKTYWIIIGIVVLSLGGFRYWNNNSEQRNISFETALIEKGNIEMVISASGTLNATNTVEVGTQVSGVIENVLVDFNDRVKTDQVIARLDARNLQANLEQAKASVLQAQVQLEQKKRAYDLTQQYNSENGKDLTVLEAEASVEQVRTQMELAQRNYERYKDLYEKGVVAKVDFETRESDYKRLKASFESVYASLNRTKANVSKVDVQKSFEDLRTAEANLASAKAGMEKAKINLDYAIIRAPIDGVVLSRNIEVGQTVAASFSTPVLFIIANDLTKMEIEASIDEADIGFIKEGQSVNFTVDAYIDKTFEGKVEEIRLQPEVVSNVVTYAVIVSAANDDMMLMPGMTANLDVIAAQRKKVLMAPVAALNFSPPSKYQEPWKDYLKSEGMTISISDDNWETGFLWKVENETIVPKKIKIGLSDGSFTEVSSNDFTENDKVVVEMNGVSSKSSSNTSTNPFIPSRPSSKKKQANE
jgi:HlyD family secretion protein